MKHRASALLIAAFALISALTAHAQSPDMLADLAARINRERTSRGLVPYALNSDLTRAAQTHASDIAHTGNLSHVGSDGSTVFQRVARTGYGSYSWGRRLGENWAWYHTPADAMQKWMESRPHRENILHALYREFGIGIAPNPVGGYVFVIVFGAQPNVLPIFINDGSGSTLTPAVTMVLSDEEVAPWGDTPTTIGYPVEIEISNDPSFSGAKWQQYSTRQSWSLIAGTGIKTVYVKFRDAKGRTTTSSDSIALGSAAAMNVVVALPTVKPTASRTPTRRPTATRTRTPRPTAKPSPTVTRTAIPTRTIAISLASDEATVTPMPDAQTTEPTASPTDSPPVGVTLVAAIVATPPLVDEQPPDPEEQDTAAAPLFEEMMDWASAAATFGMRDSGEIALGVFAMAALIGIMAAIAASGFRTGHARAAQMQMRTKRRKK